MVHFPSCLQLEFSQPTTRAEENRVETHAQRLRTLHREWMLKIQECGQSGLLSYRASLMKDRRIGDEVAYLSPEAENIARFRFWGMTFNDICLLEDQLAAIDVSRYNLVLFTERHVDTNLTHFSLFAVDLLCGNLRLMFHRSNCIPELPTARAAVGNRAYRALP